MIPGANILNMALSLMSKSSVAYYKNTGRVTNARGNDVATYADPITVATGQVQPVPRNRYQNMGLNYQENYITWFVQLDVIDLMRDFSGDKVVWNGQTYTLKSKTDWYAQDGWVYVLCVQVS